MDQKKLQSVGRDIWALAKRQHGVVSRAQLLALGMDTNAIHHRIINGRLHRIRRGVYAVGRPQLTATGRWIAATLSCGPHAVLSHRSAAELWAIRSARSPQIEITVPPGVFRRRAGIRLHRRALRAEDRDHHRGIPVTSPARTIFDLATCMSPGQVETAISEADKRDLIDPVALRSAVDERSSLHGVAVVRKILDRRTFALTDSELERRFLRLVRDAGVPRPETGRRVNGFRVDFYWRDLGLVVETDGLRYHRTPAQQARDRLRDQAHTAAGLTPLRFTNAQVRFEPEGVASILAAVARRLRAAPRR